MVLVLEPPPQYVHPYPGTIIERVLPVAEARRACAALGLWNADACSRQYRNKCELILPKDGPAVGGIAPYRRHELAHCNGWPASHPGGWWPK